MKRIIALCLVFVLALSLTACGSDKMYYDYDMTKYVTLGDYSKEIDTTSDVYKYYAADFYSDALSQTIKKGKVEEGDTANIDFAGYLNGVAFEGGTSEDYDLTIGAGQFIDGFEEGLIGVEIGSTVDLDLTFPENYGNEELNGKDVVFTVTVNYVNRDSEATEETVKNAGYSSVEAFEKEMQDYAVSMTMLNNALSAATVIDYPQKEMDLLLQLEVEYYETLCEMNDTTLTEFIASNNMTLDQFKETVTENTLKGNMKYFMVGYAVLQKNNIQITKQDVEDMKATLIEENGENALDGLNDIDIQQETALRKACDFFVKEAIVK